LRVDLQSAPTMTLVGLTIHSPIEFVVVLGLGFDLDADRASDSAPNDTSCYRAHEFLAIS